ncbi:MAG: hypothetical protein ACD_22C00082G0018 [uncultured bacterium]|nr:MAG: hypothetical protein ACD_22C00082G0018 [uncultured bacterium]
MSDSSIPDWPMTWTTFQEGQHLSGQIDQGTGFQGNNMSQQSDKKKTFQIRLDRGWWKILSQLKTNTRWSFRSLVEHALVEMYTGKSTKELDNIFGERGNA